MIFLLSFLDVIRMSMSTIFPHTAKLWSSLAIEWFPLSYDQNGFKSRLNRNLLSAGSF